eukprot:SAG31_NODE_1294_length_8954_cov_2.434557_7_plen_92_part_00
MARCEGKSRSRNGTRSEKAMDRRKRVAAAARSTDSFGGDRRTAAAGLQDALLADVDALVEQVAATTAVARWSAADDAAFYGFGHVFGPRDQ